MRMIYRLNNDVLILLLTKVSLFSKYCFCVGMLVKHSWKSGFTPSKAILTYETYILKFLAINQVQVLY